MSMAGVSVQLAEAAGATTSRVEPLELDRVADRCDPEPFARRLPRRANVIL